MRLAGLLLVMVSACSSNTTAGSTPAPTSSLSAAATQSPSTLATPQPTVQSAPGLYAVIVNDFQQGGPTYTVSLVDTNGNIAATATGKKRSTFAQMSDLSTSRSTVYYLNGDGDIRYLRPDGSSGLATSFTVATHQVIAFAVSPDDKRIAVSVLDYTTYPVSTRLFVEDLVGHGNRIELFSSPTVLEWPAGWHNGRLVMALGIEAPPQNAYEGFMRGHGYHVADAATGNRLLSLCDGLDSYIPESAGGTVCVQPQGSFITSWDGNRWAPPVLCAGPVWGPLSPDGTMASRTTGDVASHCVAGSIVYLVTPSGFVMDAVNPAPRTFARDATPEGWIDANYLVVLGDGASSLTIFGTKAGSVNAQVAAPGFFAAALPGGL